MMSYQVQRFVLVVFGIVVLFGAVAGMSHVASAHNLRSSQGQSSPMRSSSQASAQPSQERSRPGQKTFSSPEEAVAALYAAAHNDDEDGMLVILGPAAKDIVIWTENPADRKADVDLFAKKYEQMHRLVREPDDETTLYVGAENWPLPIPLIEKNGVWYFDAGLGRQEILYRRIGENELDTVDVLRALVDAENEYYAQSTGADGVPQYAHRLNSDQGLHDGLYWPGSGNATASPIGPYVAQASYKRSDRTPLRGYYFRMLTEQGPRAPGGTRKYLVNGKMTGGFAFVAFPAEYRSSGVMTFIVSQDDTVYEKDLGPTTAQVAAAMTAYNPDTTWTKVR